MTSPAPTPLWLRRFTKLTAVSTLFLIFAGAMVTSTGSGLAVPDWPLSYGMVFPPMVGGIFYEHGHRMIAASVGFLTVLQAVWLQLKEPKRWLSRLGWVAVGAVVLQGLLGGLTVLFLLPKAISIGHAALAELFFCTNVAVAFFASSSFIRLRSQRTAARGSSTLPTILVVAIFVQILLGALMRHLGAGLAIPDFPLSFGRLIPDLSTAAVAVNFAHRLGALTVVILALVTGKAVFSASGPTAPRRVMIFLAAVLSVQIVLGALTVWSGRNPIIASLHVMTGALTLASALVLTLTARATSEESARVWRRSVRR